MDDELMHRLDVLHLPSNMASSPTNDYSAATPISSVSELSANSSSAGARSVPDTEDEGDDMYCEIRSTPDKGKCLFATRSIKPGTLIFTEEPLMSLSRELEESYDAIEDAFSELKKNEKKAYLSLFDAKKSRMSAVVSIYYSNCYSTDSFVSSESKDFQQEGGSCIGALASRINHSCVPNVCFSYLPQSSCHPKGQIRFHAIKAISKGKELHSNYDKSIFEVAAKRRQKYLLHYGFKCSCEACVPPSAFWSKSDERRRAMRDAVGKLKVLEREWQKLSVDENEVKAKALEVCQEAVAALSALEDALVKEKLAYTPLANAYRSLAKWAIRAGDSPRQWLLKEKEISVLMSGKRSLRSQALMKEIAMVDNGPCQDDV